MQQRNGAGRDELLAALFTWVREKGTVAALDIAGDIYLREASRGEFSAFEQLASLLPGSEHAMKRVRFEIFNRTLN